MFAESLEVQMKAFEVAHKRRNYKVLKTHGQGRRHMSNYEYTGIRRPKLGKNFAYLKIWLDENMQISRI